MVFSAASALDPPTLTVASSKSRTHHLINFHRKHVSVTCSVKYPGMEYFNEQTNLMSLLNHTKVKLWTFVPGSVKQFPWKKAESVAQHKLLVLGKETLKWSLLGCFAFNCLSDIVYSISRNRELLIPLGLFVGILMTKFMDEISQELLSDHKGGCIKGLLGMSVFFVLLKVISAFFFGVNDFLFHVANGGLIQALWNWKEFMKSDAEKSSWDDVSVDVDK
ncbi:hypothetical protein ACS0TY_023717 [Phlomoides rotata]